MNMPDPETKVAIEREAAELTLLIIEVENRLKTLNMGVRAYTPLTTRHSFLCLEFSKHDGFWQLTVAGLKDFDRPVPLTSAPVSVRVAAVKAFPSLLDAMVSAADRELFDLEKAVEDVKEFLAAFDQVR